MNRRPPHTLRGVTAIRWEQALRQDLRERRWLRWHCSLIAMFTLLAAWGASHGMKAAGMDALPLRYGAAFVLAYAVLAVLTYVWAKYLISREEPDVPLDVLVDAQGGSAPSCEPAMQSGGGGDFGGGGAGAPFDDAPASIAEAATNAAGSTFEATAEVAAAADEGAVIVLPLLVVLAVAAGLASVFGLAVFGLFGVEVLLGVAVEVAIAASSGAVLYKAQREGWLMHFLRRTLVPAALVLAILVAFGGAIEFWMPQADSLPHAVRLLRG